MGVLLIVFATVIGYATFVENDYDAITAKALIYNARWFEVLLALMVINFLGMIFTKHLYLKSKWNILIIHVALVVIIIGAGLTRYIGFEGQMHIRNGQTSSTYYTTDSYFNIQLTKGEDEKTSEQKVVLTPVSNNLFEEAFVVDDTEIQVTIDQYIPNAAQELMINETGDPYLSIIVGGSDGRHDVYLKEGETQFVHEFGVSFGDTTNENTVQIIRNEGELLVRLPHGSTIDNSNDEAVSNSIAGFVPLSLMNVHTVQNTSFVVKQFIEHAEFHYKAASGGVDTGNRVAKIKVNDQDIFLKLGVQESLTVNDVVVNMSLGKQARQLPFALKLNEFQLDRYPGSNSPSSFASDIVLIDEANNVQRPYRIFMNNILEYKGFRFYQSSYDQDERGTILSVNSDYWGTLVTYVGYFLLFGSLIASFFTRKTRFIHITKQINEVHVQRKKLVTSLLLLVSIVLGGPVATAQNSQVGLTIDKEHAASFGQLLVQNRQGRIEPVNTAANKLLIKLYKKTKYKGLTADQVFLGMTTNPTAWRSESMIIIREEAIRNQLGIIGEYASFSDFFDGNGQYKLSEAVEKVYATKPALRGTYDKELVRVDERINVCYMVLGSTLLNIFPIEGDANNKWVTPREFHDVRGHGTAEGDMFEDYIQKLNNAITSNNYNEADAALAVIGNFQKDKGSAVVLSGRKVQLEILYNQLNIFKKLFPVYMLIGAILIGLFFIQLIKPAIEFKKLTTVFVSVLFVAFLLQTAGLGVRWYISGHAPWSNGYESMIYIAWATMLAGFFLMKKTPVTIGVTAMLAGITLLTAHMSWLDPEITNLVPVLKSYWLTIHVATITASYGFLGLGCMMGFLNLCLMVIRRKDNLVRVNLALKELTLITELSLIIGLVLLIIGNFLGGIWANESWGRYWGWDPKETWTLVTIILYSFTLHMTLIPSIKNKFTFNFMSIISFGAVLMTYFGVNYYLSGLHSYAGGDSVPVPDFVYYALLVIVLVSSLAAYSEHKFSNSSPTGSKELAE